MTIGAVSYLNALPLINGLPHPVQTATPRELLSQLIQKKLSLAMLSTVCIFQYPELYLVPGMGICSRGRVESVRLFFNRPNVTPSQLQLVRLSPESNTANMLVQLYLKQVGYRANAPLTDRVDTDADAELVIGDTALTRVDTYGSVDLGQWWWEWTGLPFVFAGWISRSATISKTLHDELLRCKSENLADIPRCVASTTAFGAIPRPLQESYLRDSIHYDIGEAELAGLNRFRDECIRAELISNANPIRLVTIS